MNRVRALGLAIAATLACAPVPQTEIVVVVSSDLPRGTTLRSVRVVAQRSGASAPMHDVTYRLTDTRFPLPGEVTLVARDPDDARPLTVRVVGEVEGRALSQEAVARFQRERTLYLQMTLSSLCVDRDCGAGNTCRLGECVPSAQVPLSESRPTTLQAGDGALPTDAADDAPRADVSDVVNGSDVVDAGIANDAPDVVNGSDVVDVPPRWTVVDVPPAMDVVDVPPAVDVVTDAGSPDACPTTLTSCAGACVDTSSSQDHCGACGRSCGAGTLCIRGTCTINRQRSCAPGVPGCGEVIVAGGTFTMGEGAPAVAASPVQPGTTVQSFAIDAYEVTVARFRRWVAAGRPAPSGPVVYPGGQVISLNPSSAAEPFAQSMGSEFNWSPTSTNRDAHPMNGINWWAAQEFCVWDGGRLPTEAEWEFVALGRAAAGLTPGRLYPWGDTPPSGCDRAQWSGCATMEDGARNLRVGHFAGVAGVFDLAGNVAEWTADWSQAYSDPRCWGTTPRTNPLCQIQGMGSKPFRGGAFESSVAELRSASRNGNGSIIQYPSVGFRCVRTR